MVTYRELSGKQRLCVRSILRGVFPKGLGIRSYLYGEVFPEDVEAEEDYIRGRAEVWVKSQRGYGQYGKYSQLAGKIMDSGMVFSPVIHRSHLTRAILENDGRAYAGVSVFQVAKNTLRILKCKHSKKQAYAYMVKCICKNTDRIIQVSKTTRDAGYNTAEEMFTALSGISNWHCISIQHPPKPFKDAYKWGKCSSRYDDDCKVLARDIENFGYASACLYLADLGVGYRWCQPYVDRLRELRDMLLSEDDAKILDALEVTRELMKEISIARKGGDGQRVPRDAYAEDEHTSVFN